VERDEILARLRERIVAFAASTTGREPAEDLAQDVLMLLHTKYPEVERIEELLPLSLRILRYKVIAARRKALRRGEHLSVGVDESEVAGADPSPEMEAENREMRERLIRALAQTEERCRRLMRMKLQGRSFAEMQREFGARSINTIYTWDFRCRQRLQELMGAAR
jgi:RNA polymerase sigma-70 factor (ECF subfamily)